jgi:hypothetical protein
LFYDATEKTRVLFECPLLVCRNRVLKISVKGGKSMQIYARLVLYLEWAGREDDKCHEFGMTNGGDG